MAFKSVLTVVALVALTWAGSSNAQSSSSCTNVLISMSPCLNYITGNSSTPSSSCCSQLGSVVSSQPQCLCQVLSGGAGSSIGGLNINQTQALALPGACNVQTPPVSRCNDAAGSPMDSPSGTKDTPTTKQPGNGSKNNVPTTDGNSSDGSSIKLSFSLLFFLLSVLSNASF